MQQPKKLIEIAMPVKEISAESVRDKSIRHGHISTLHLWWARRPLPVCRAVVFASLVPDPLDPNCPQAFKDAVELLLGRVSNPSDPYQPYRDIPFTAAIDPMEDNLRNRLLMFIGKFSPQFLKNEKLGKKTPAKDQLSDFSLIKWDNKNNGKIINKARQLIWVAHQAEQQQTNGLPPTSAHQMLADFDRFYGAIKTAQAELCQTVDRHLPSPETAAKEQALQQAIDAFLDQMPRVFDPFAGGGAIPLEAARLGCRSFANDLNPVAHIIEKGSLEFPQKYGKSIIFTKGEFLRQYGAEALHNVQAQGLFGAETDVVEIPNRLAFDVAFYAKKLLKLAEAEIGQFYPADVDGNKPIAYYWARVATCGNPACGAEVPLLKQFYLVNKGNKKIYLKPVIRERQISFEIRRGTCEDEGWNYRGNLKCPCCGQTTDVKKIKEQSKSGLLKENMLAVITEGENGKAYKLPTENDLKFLEQLPEDIENWRPTEAMQRNSAGGDTFGWGISKWGQMFTQRQLLALQTLVAKLQEIKQELNPHENEYAKAVVTYLGILVDRIAPILTSFGRWDVTRENVQSPFSRQAIPMIFDYPEGNPFGQATGSVYNQVDWIIRYIESESQLEFSSDCKNSSSGEISQFDEKYLSSVITDPPYYDAIAYADLSDFFYVWLKRTVLDLFPLNFATPQTPKSEECTALKHHHQNSFENAKNHFEDKLLDIFSVIEKQTNGLISIMFAHQSTQAWTTLCNSILNAQMNIMSSWAIDTELGNRMIAMDKAALASSVTVSCRPTEKLGFGDFLEIKQAVQATIKTEVSHLYKLGFRGADLLTACFGQAVSEFGKYEQVEKADGTPVTVAELLELARAAAFNAIIGDIETDDVTRFYIGWLNLFGFTPTEHDTVRRITQIGLNIDVNQLLAHNILLREGNKESLATGARRVAANARLGRTAASFTIDKVHQALHLQQADREGLLRYLSVVAPTAEGHFWRVLNSLSELLLQGSEERRQVEALLANKESLLRDARRLSEQTETQLDLDFE